MKTELSPAEVAACELFAQGYEIKSIAKRQCRSPSTVNSHLTRARVKLGIHTHEGLRVFLIAKGKGVTAGEVEYESWGFDADQQ